MYLRISFNDRTTFELNDVKNIQHTDAPKESLIVDYADKYHTELLQRTFRWGDIKGIQIR